MEQELAFALCKNSGSSSLKYLYLDDEYGGMAKGVFKVWPAARTALAGALEIGLLARIRGVGARQRSGAACTVHGPSKRCP